MNEGARRRRLVAEVVNVGHHVVPQPALVLSGFVEVGVVQVRAELRDRGIGNP